VQLCSIQFAPPGGLEQVEVGLGGRLASEKEKEKVSERERKI
jgi:hypothetical protein